MKGLYMDCDALISQKARI